MSVEGRVTRHGLPMRAVGVGHPRGKTERISVPSPNVSPSCELFTFGRGEPSADGPPRNNPKPGLSPGNTRKQRPRADRKLVLGTGYAPFPGVGRQFALVPSGRRIRPSASVTGVASGRSSLVAV